MKHEGHLYPQSVNDWFSAAIDRKICLVHSSNLRFKSLEPNRHIHSTEGDLRKTFTTDAAFHMVNHNSVEDLKEKVKRQHPNEPAD